MAARLVREVADLVRRAEHAKKPLATLAIEADIRFSSAADRAAFTIELTSALTSALTKLVSRYHDETATGGRWHRVFIASHPRPAKP